ncbi:MAG: hypothetical protein ABW166_08025 [Sedimenticola sp.]
MTRANNPFYLPKRRAADAGSEVFLPKSFRFWVETLPTGDIDQSAQDLHHQLKVMNSYEMPAVNRMENLELMLPQLLLVLDELTERNNSEPFPQTRHDRFIYKLDMSLYVLIIQAYKITLEHYHQESIVGHLLHRHKRAVAIHRVVYFLGRTLLHSFHHYQPAPDSFWQELHGFYHYAAHHGLDRMELDNEDHLLVDSLTVIDIYCQALLLALADPYQLKRGEASHVYVALKRWAKRCHIRPLDVGKSYPNGFVVALGVDAPPMHLVDGQAVDTQEGWIIDCDEVIVLLIDELSMTQAQLSSIRPYDDLKVVTPDLLTRLMLAWGGGGKRSLDRVESQGDVVITFGLNTLYVLFGGEEAPELFDIGITVDTIQVEEKIGVHYMAHDPFFIEGAPDFSQAKIVPPQVVEKPPPSGQIAVENNGFIRECMVFDESDHGYHLGWIGKGDSGIRVGEMVGLSTQLSELADQLQLCIVRWMRASKPGLLDFGVEVVNGDLATAIVRQQKPGESGYVSYRAFLQTRSDGMVSLITPPFYSLGVPKMVLVQKRMVRKIVLDRVIESTSSFIQFSFNEIEQCSESELESRVEESEGLTQFDTLWKNI